MTGDRIRVPRHGGQVESWSRKDVDRMLRPAGVQILNRTDVALLIEKPRWWPGVTLIQKW